MSEIATPVQRSVATRPTKTRWWILFLISLMYLICYMDRGNISVAAPEIAREFHLSKTQMGLILACFGLGLWILNYFSGVILPLVMVLMPAVRRATCLPPPAFPASAATPRPCVRGTTCP